MAAPGRHRWRGAQAQPGGRFNLVFTGTFTPAQSLETVITAVQDARSRGADMLHLLLVGDGMSRASPPVKELHAEDAVTFYGSVPATDIPRFTALADALIVCLSDSPDLGLTVLAVASYMAAGKPVLASMDGAGNAAVAAAGGLSPLPAMPLPWQTTCWHRPAWTPSAPPWARAPKNIILRITAAASVAQTGTFYFEGRV